VEASSNSDIFRTIKAIASPAGSSFMLADNRVSVLHAVLERIGHREARHVRMMD
jgi:hypothetical protein